MTASLTVMADWASTILVIHLTLPLHEEVGSLRSLFSAFNINLEGTVQLKCLNLRAQERGLAVGIVVRLFNSS